VLTSIAQAGAIVSQ